MSVEYRGITFPGYNKPIKSNREGKKKMVLAKKGDKVKLIHFGATGYGHNYSAAARKSFRARHKCVTQLRTFCLHGTGHVALYGVGQVSLNNLVLNHVRENTNG